MAGGQTGVSVEWRRELEAQFGAIRDITALAGGCISPAFRVRLSAGTDLFVKTARPGWPLDAFAAEAHSLARLRATHALVVPQVLGSAAGWLALEWLEPGQSDTTRWRSLGQGLARLHRHRSGRYGWDSDNYIGPLRQLNGWTADWPTFWRDRRLLPLMERAADRLDRGAIRDIERLARELDDRLGAADVDGASLLHGDLWSGNVHMCDRGAGVIDPASYHGHREVDLAMAALFGGFPLAFFEGYEAEWPLLEDAARRRPIYQLYYLLVHVVLFGGSYLAGTTAALRDALR